MLRIIGMTSLSILLLAACGENAREPSFVSEAMASSVTTGPDYGWRTEIAPDAAQDGAVKEYY